MLTAVCEDLLVDTRDIRLTAAEANAREARREALVRMLAEIAAPLGEKSREDEFEYA